MVCIIDRRGYVLRKSEATDAQHKMIAEKLNVKIIDPSGFKDPTSYDAFTESRNFYYLPKYWGLEHIDPNPVTKFTETSSMNARFNYKNFTFRKMQWRIISDMFAHYLEDSGKPILKQFCDKFINVGTGVGKSILALIISTFLRKRAIIVVHTTEIIEQWKEYIEEFVIGAKVGYISGKKYKIDECDFVICTVQSLMKSKLPLKELLSDFDTVIYDEAHHYCSQVFSNVLRKIVTRYSISLTATIDRPDGLERVLHWYLGDIGFKIEGQLDYDVEIDVIEFTPKDKKYFKELPLPGKKQNTGKMMSNLILIPERNKMIVDKVKDVFTKEPNRHILIISHRVSQMEYFKEEFAKLYGEDAIGMIVGKTGEHMVKNNDMKAVTGKKIVIGIYNLCKESVNIPGLCCVVLATPMSRVLQSCGRMFRREKHEYEYYPLVIDIKDTLRMYQNMGVTRMKQYVESYLDSDNSSLKFFKCSFENNYEIVHVRTVDLKDMLLSSNLGATKLQKTKSGRHDICFDSDGDD
jgi:superfamily II DNA or RNA helicase